VYAEENLPGEELAPGEDGLPADSEPMLEEVKRVAQVRVATAADIGRGHLSVKCSVRLTLAVSLHDPDDEPVSISPTWPLCLLVDPEAGKVLEHSHGWDSDYRPDPS
jgi:hypothetical protein